MNFEGQPSLFDPIASRNARTEAIEQVDSNAHAEFKSRAAESVLAVARRRGEFTTDDLVFYMAEMYPGVATHDNRAWGPVMRDAARAGWVTNTGRVQESNMVSNHRRPKAIWRSNFPT